MSEWYKPNLAQWIKYEPDEIKVKIERGNLTSGVLDKRSIGAGASGGIYHLIANEYGSTRAIEVLHDMQQMAIAYIMQYGYTIGIMDLLVSGDAKLEVDRIAADIMNKSQLITEKLHNGEIIPPIGKTVEEFYEEQQINVLRIFDDFTEPILKSINPYTNNLFKLIGFGSKGKLENMYNIMSTVGQKLINGERIRQKFGFKRTLAYFPRFDTSPESRGYITNSYLGGMNSSEYVFNAMASRFDFISKALSTSVTGEQNRKSIKNLESAITNNFRWVVKNQNIIQISYGEDFLDPRCVERVKFPTIMMSDDQFQIKYSHEGFPNEFKTMQGDRDRYRSIFFSIEGMGSKELISDERRMPVSVERIMGDVLGAHAQMLKPVDDRALRTMCGMVNTMCGNLPYILINEIQERRKSPIPEHISMATWLVAMSVRSYLHPLALQDAGMTPELLQIVLDKIRLKYSQSLIEPGTAVGIIAAQSFSEPLTQYMLDAHHRSALGGTSKSTMVKVKEVLGAKDVDKLDSPMMTITVLPEYQRDRYKVQEIANNIESMKLEQFISMWQVFFERFGRPIHSNYASEETHIRDFLRMNPLMKAPGDLIHWCIRMVVSRTALILKNMSLETIITKLRELYPELYIIYTPENSGQIIMRIYIRNSMLKKEHMELNDILGIKNTLLGTIIRGIEGITNATVSKLIRNKVDDTGAIVLNDGIWCITTNGTNLRGVLANKHLERLTIQTDAIQEVYRTLGIEAARQRLITEVRNLVDAINHRHYLMYVDEMTYTGRVTSIESAGLRTREAGNVLLRVGFSSPISTLETAAVDSMEDTVSGMTAPFLIGSVPMFGTLYNSFIVNGDFVREHVRRPDDYLDDLM